MLSCFKANIIGNCYGVNLHSVIAFLYLEYKQNLSRQYPVERLTCPWMDFQVTTPQPTTPPSPTPPLWFPNTYQLDCVLRHMCTLLQLGV